MIKTFKVTVGGESTSFYIEPMYKEKIVQTLQNFDILSPVNRKMKMPKPDSKVVKILTKEEGGCIRCGKPRRKNSNSKQWCDNCRNKNREQTN